MRSISIQVQPDKAPDIDMDAVHAAFAAIAADAALCEQHDFNDGIDVVLYFNFTFATPDAPQLWAHIWQALYGPPLLGDAMRACSMAMVSGEEGWDTYQLLFHYDPLVPVEPLVLDR